MATSAQRLVLRNGHVYAATKGKPTAIIVSAGEVEWIGSERALSKHLKTGDKVVDLDHMIVMPAFCDAHRKAFGINDAFSLMDRHDGVGAAHVFPIIAGRGATISERMGRWLVAPLRTRSAPRRTREVALIAESTPTSESEVTAHLEESFESDVAACFSVVTETDLDAIVAGAKTWKKKHETYPRIRIDGLASAPAPTIRALGKIDASIVFDGHRVNPTNAAQAVKADIPIAFGSFGSQINPWMWLHNVVAGARPGKSGKSGLSVPDAIAAVTGNGWKLAGTDPPWGIEIGSAMPISIWRAFGDHLEEFPDLRDTNSLPQWAGAVSAGILEPGPSLAEQVAAL